MDTDNFDLTCGSIVAAVVPEDIFGADATLEDGKRTYRRLAKVVHADHAPDGKGAIATQAFQKLASLWALAQSRMAAGTYGTRVLDLPVPVKVRGRQYQDWRPFRRGDVSDLFVVASTKGATTTDVLVKVARHPNDGDLLKNEFDILRALQPEGKADPLASRGLPTGIDSFVGQDGRRANVLEFRRLVPMADVIQAFPDGIDPRDAVWMWKRTLGLIALAAHWKYTHGAALPCHILLDLPDHGACLCDWSYAVSSGNQPVPALVPGYDSYYPAEVLNKRPGVPATDVFMVAKSITKLLGGDPGSGSVPKEIPAPIRNLLRACTLKDPETRFRDAWQVHQIIDHELENMFGPRKFRKFTMPATAQS